MGRNRTEKGANRPADQGTETAVNANSLWHSFLSLRTGDAIKQMVSRTWADKLAMPLQVAERVIEISPNVGTNTVGGQLNATALNFLFEKVDSCPRLVTHWGGPLTSGVSPVMIVGASGAGKSTWAGFLQGKGHSFLDSDALLLSLTERVQGLTMPGRLPAGWFDRTLKLLEAGDARYLAIGRRYAGLIASLRLGATSSLGWQLPYTCIPGLPRCYSVIIEPKQSYGGFSGYERYALTCWQRCATSVLKNGRPHILHVSSEAKLSKRILEAKQSSSSYVTVAAYADMEKDYRRVARFLAYANTKAWETTSDLKYIYSQGWTNISPMSEAIGFTSPASKLRR